MDEKQKKPKYIQTDNTIDRWMTRNVITLTESDRIKDALSCFTEHDFYGVPVVDDNYRLEGLVTKTSVMNALYKAFDTSLSVKTIMDTSLEVLSPLDSLEKAINMTAGCVPVISEERKLVGIITRTDLLMSQSTYKDATPELNVNNSIIRNILDSVYEGVIITDADGMITEINDLYCSVLEKRKKDILNKPVKKIVENTRLDICCQTGVKEINKIQIINNQKFIVHRIPIVEKSRVLGAIGILNYSSVDTFISNLELQYVDTTEQQYYLSKIIGMSAYIDALKKRVVTISNLPSNILITGESGTGKELWAKTIHAISSVSKGPFIAVNCAAMPESLLESELFGYVDGAFTGALKGGKVGLFESANNGTIFLDEIGDMPLYMQAKLLRVLQEKEIVPVGATNSIKINARVICATNQNLVNRIEKGEFRSDLFFRINVFNVRLHPLRENTEDIMPLLNFFIKKYAELFNKPVPFLDEKAKKILISYNYPGNIRELSNICEHMVGLCNANIISVEDIPSAVVRSSSEIDVTKTSLLKSTKDITERNVIMRTLQECGGNKSMCAKALGIHRSVLYQKIRKYGIIDA